MVVVTAFVAVFVTVTLAFGTTAPVASLTVPEIVPRSDCANAGVNVERNSNTKTELRRQHIVRLL
jgi:hypothetical protein